MVDCKPKKNGENNENTKLEQLFSSVQFSCSVVSNSL